MSLLTRQGYDLQFGVNVLGHFYLTQLLLPVLLGTARATAQRVRVLNYTSCTPPAPRMRIDYTTLMDGPVRRKLSPAQLHKQSKLVSLESRPFWTIRNKLIVGLGSEGNSIVSTGTRRTAWGTGTGLHRREPRCVRSLRYSAEAG